MKILRITGFINEKRNKIEIKELEAEEKKKTYIYKNNFGSKNIISKNDLKLLQTIFKNTIDPNSIGTGFILQSYCLIEDKDEVIKSLKLELNKLVNLLNQKTLNLIGNRFKDIE